MRSDNCNAWPSSRTSKKEIASGKVPVSGIEQERPIPLMATMLKVSPITMLQMTDPTSRSHSIQLRSARLLEGVSKGRDEPGMTPSAKQRTVLIAAGESWWPFESE